MGGRARTVTKHGDRFCVIKLTEECPECKSFKTDLQMEAKAMRRRFYECRACGCKWMSTPQPSAVVEPVVIEGRESEDLKDAVETIRKLGFPVRDESEVEIGDDPVTCVICGQELSRPFTCFGHGRIFVPKWVPVCPDRSACERRRDESWAERERRRGERDDVIKFGTYEHHGVKVWVRKDLQGKHREHCLCHSCRDFIPGD